MHTISPCQRRALKMNACVVCDQLEPQSSNGPRRAKIIRNGHPPTKRGWKITRNTYSSPLYIPLLGMYRMRFLLAHANNVCMYAHTASTAVLCSYIICSWIVNAIHSLRYRIGTYGPSPHYVCMKARKMKGR